MIAGAEHCGPGGCKLRIAGVSKVFDGRRGKVVALEGINLNIRGGGGIVDIGVISIFCNMSPSIRYLHRQIDFTIHISVCYNLFFCFRFSFHSIRGLSSGVYIKITLPGCKQNK